MVDSRVALVTGASQGIGREIALRLARDGFDVAVSDLPSAADSIDTVVKEIISTGRNALSVPTDVTVPEQISEMVRSTVEGFGRLDVTVANAGVARLESLLDTTPEQWDQTFAVNVRGVFLTWQAAAKHYISRGGGGKLIGASSQNSYQAGPALPAYTASKWSVRGLTQSAAREFAQHKITVNSYAPGVVDTPLWKDARERFEAIVKTIPLGRAQQPEDVADLVSFLASPAADYITGQTIMTNGGMILS